jgi:hypothetical protein
MNIPVTGIRTVESALARAIDAAWYSRDVTGIEQPPSCLNGEYLRAPNAAGTGYVNMIGVDSSNRVSFPAAIAPKAAGAINLASVVPSTETTGSLITTGTTWVTVTAAGGCAAKLLCAYSGATGDYATLRMRARADAAGASDNGVICGNFSASANINDYPNLYAVQGYAQPSAVGTTVRTQSVASNIVCALYGCVDRQAGATSNGRDWCLWVDTHMGVKATGGTYLARFSHNGTAAADGVFTIYNGGRMPVLFNFEDAAGCLVDSGDAGSTKAGYLVVTTPAGTKKIQLVTT